MEAVTSMVAVEQPRADCGHVARLTQQCGKCLRWCCPECYAPWTALACGACRAEARAAAADPYAVRSATLRTQAFESADPSADARLDPFLEGTGDLRRPVPIQVDRHIGQEGPLLERHEIGAAFGGSSQTVFGASGAGNVLTKTTAALAFAFFLTSGYLALNSTQRATGSIFGGGAPSSVMPQSAPE